MHMADIFVKFVDYNKSNFHLGTKRRLRSRIKDTFHNCLCLVSLIAAVLWSSSSNAPVVGGGGGGESVRCMWRANNGCEGDLLVVNGCL